MAIHPADLLRPALRDDEVPPGPLAGTRSQSMQRLQMGLFGLAAMVLLVGLANVIINNAEQNAARVVPEAAPTVATDRAAASVSDPLADAGVVPADAGAEQVAGAAAQSGNAPAPR